MTEETLVLTHRVHSQVLEALEPHVRVVSNQTDESLSRAELLDRLGDATGVVVFPPDVVDAEFLAHAPLLRVVSGAFTGSDNIDVRSAAERGVTCSNVPDLLADATAELAVTLLLGLARRIREGDRMVRSSEFGGWSSRLLGTGLSGARVGLVGAGQVGRAVAKRLTGFGVTLSYADPRAVPPTEAKALGLERMMLDALLEQSDMVVVCAPLTAESRGLFDRSRLGLMRPGALLVNVARGSIVDEEAVAASIASNHLGGYAADVFAFEDGGFQKHTPAPAGSPTSQTGIPEALLALEQRTLFTPHLGSSVTDARFAIEMRAAENAVLLLRGEEVTDVLFPRPEAELAGQPRKNR